MITVFVDASHCPQTKAAGWGAWAKGHGWERGIACGGPLKMSPLNSSEAEIAPDGACDDCFRPIREN